MNKNGILARFVFCYKKNPSLIKKRAISSLAIVLNLIFNCFFLLYFLLDMLIPFQSIILAFCIEYLDEDEAKAKHGEFAKSGYHIKHGLQKLIKKMREERTNA